MLCLSRKESETIKIGDNITITIVRLGKSRVLVGIEAPADVPIMRGEIERKYEDER